MIDLFCIEQEEDTQIIYNKTTEKRIKSALSKLLPKKEEARPYLKYAQYGNTNNQIICNGYCAVILTTPVSLPTPTSEEEVAPKGVINLIESLVSKCKEQNKIEYTAPTIEELTAYIEEHKSDIYRDEVSKIDYLPYNINENTRVNAI